MKNIKLLALSGSLRKASYNTAATELISAVKHADGLIIASPEYAHGISGPMKNALDWLVGCVEFPCKPIMLINTSPRASHAQLSLIEVLNTMTGKIINEACLSIPLLSSELDMEGIIKNQSMADQLTVALNVFIAAIKNN